MTYVALRIAIGVDGVYGWVIGGGRLACGLAGGEVRAAPKALRVCGKLGMCCLVTRLRYACAGHRAETRNLGCGRSHGT